MINPRSPIVNQLIGGGYQQGYPPNYCQVGYNGYNGQQGYTGYYGNQVNYNYYNPIYQQNLIAKQREEEEKQRKAYIAQNKAISRIAHAYSGTEITEEQLNKLYEPQVGKTQQQLADDYEFGRVASIVTNGQEVKYDANFAQKSNEIKKYHDSVVDPNSGLLEFFNNAGTLYVNALLRDELHRNRNLSGTYDSNSYKQLLGVRQAPYAGVFSNNIDDNVITLPESIRQHAQESYEVRRAKFIASIMGGAKNG